MQRAPLDPSLPQNDTPAQQAARAAQLQATCGTYQWTTDVPTLPGVPLVAALPSNETPTLEWWMLLIGIGLDIARNEIAVKLAAIGRGEIVIPEIEIAAMLAECAKIESSVAAIKAKLAKGGGSIAGEIHLLIEAVEEEALFATLRDHVASLRAMIELSDAERLAIGSRALRSLESYRDLFATIALPGIAWQFIDDTAFARLRTAGPNAGMIAGISALPANFPLGAAQYASVVNGDTLDAALAQGRIYICDYHELEALQPGVWEGKAKFVYRPLALFAVPPGGSSLVPVAIQCGQDPLENPIFLPTPRADMRWGWEMAKQIVQVADGNYHELFAHLARTHLVIEAVAVATQRHLAEMHPIWALLLPHFEGTLFINNAAATSLIAANGPIDHIFGGTIASSQLAAADDRLAFDFSRSMLPVDLVARKVADKTLLPDYAYRDDALLVWQAIREWADGYVALYYADDAAVTGDTELAAWAVSIAGEGQVSGFPAITTRHALVDVCTMVIFTASAQHAAVNFPQRAIMDFAPAVTGAGWAASPNAQAGNDKAGWLAMMPPVSLALEQLNTLYLLGSLYYRPLGDYRCRSFPYPQWFQDPAVIGSEGPLQRFQAALAQVEEQIVARNAGRMFPYPFLQPSLIPTSTNI
ncbi:lipoxygenase family protein [Sphingomonas sp. ERG5]|uniref:lipoxygenase family protein n=1 Tax=Sphingomonas sp. ERG5 TaxID=1381597 RepID=UPI00054C3C43|nr:lipoxygenase family protein [Sphingomonas sp. ERG5]